MSIGNCYNVWFGIVSLFPEMFQSLQLGVTGRALKDNRLILNFWNPRDFTQDKHRSVDDDPYGGGPGMVMMVEPLRAAIHAAKASTKLSTTVIYLSPQGRHFTQKDAANLLNKQSAILVAGRYEGVDERLIDLEIDEEWSIGDYILTGGELAAMAIIDATARLIPGVLGDEDSAAQDSLTIGLLKYPQYTRPETFMGLSVPEILLSGNHQLIENWRLKQSLGRTWLRRPDLLAKNSLTDKELKLLTEFIDEFSNAIKNDDGNKFG